MPRHLGQPLRDERLRERAGERLAAEPHGARLQRPQDEVDGKLLARVNDVRAHGAGGQRPLADVVELAALAEVERHGHHLGARRAPSATESPPRSSSRPSRPERYAAWNDRNIPAGLSARGRIRRSEARRLRTLIISSNRRSRSPPSQPRGRRPESCRRRQPCRPLRRAAIRSISTARPWACPGSVRTTSSDSTRSSPRTCDVTARRSWSTSAEPAHFGARPRVGAVARALDEPQLASNPCEIVACVASMPRVPQLQPQHLLRGDRLPVDQLEDLRSGATPS